MTVPATNSGQMVVTVQSSNLSSLAPAMYVYNSSLGQVATASLPTTYGATIWTSNAVTAGQKYYIKVMSAGSYGRVGAYGLEVNFGSQSQPPIPPPNTVVAQQPDQGGGSITNTPTALLGHATEAPGAPGTQWAVIGNLSGWVSLMSVSQGGSTTNQGAGPAATQSVQSNGVGGAMTGSTVAAEVLGITGSSGPQGNPAAGLPVAASPTPDIVLQAVDASLSVWDFNHKRLSGIFAPSNP